MISTAGAPNKSQQMPCMISADQHEQAYKWSPENCPWEKTPRKIAPQKTAPLPQKNYSEKNSSPHENFLFPPENYLPTNLFTSFFLLLTLSSSYNFYSFLIFLYSLISEVYLGTSQHL